MPERRQTPITMWRRVKDSPPLEWESVERRLVEAEDYWLVSASAAAANAAAAGQPSPRPVWGIWSSAGHHLLLTVGSSTHWRNVGENERVAVHLPDTHDVVIVEGRAAPVTDQAVLDALVDVYNPKYGWDFAPGDPGPVLRVDPDVILAWTTVPAAQAKGSPFPVTAGRWVYEGR